MCILRKGYRIPFSTLPPLTRSPLPPRAMTNESKRKVLQQEISDLLLKDAIEEVRDGSPGFYSHLFVVPKKNGKLRPVIDLSALNRHITLERFKMETTRSIREAILPGEWAVSIDLKDAYLHIPMHPSSRKYLRFQFEGKAYQFRVLPFGISTAPFLFSKLMVVVAAAVRKLGSPVIQYFDDWLLHQLCRNALLSNLRASWRTIQELGLIPNKDKSDLVPSQTFTYVGMYFRTALGLVSVPPPRIDAILVIVQAVLPQKGLTARSFLSLLGVLNAAADLVPLGRLHMRPLQMYLLSQWRPIRDPLDTVVPILPTVLPHLRWWLNRERLSVGVPISLPDPSVTLLTDASLTGWGAHLEPIGLLFQGIWTSTEQQLHINNLELKAVFLAIQRSLPQVRGLCVMVASDNSTVVSYIRRQGGTHSISLCAETRDLLLWCAKHQVTLRSKHIPGRLNVLADYLSRGRSATLSEWSLHPTVAASCLHLWGPPTVDLFASRLNFKLPLYVSLVPDARACAQDALSLDWSGMDAFAFPPFNLLATVLRKVAQSNCLVTLVAPLWPQRSWYNQLLSLLVEIPRVLPLRSDLLSQHRGHTLHQNVECLHLHAWRLSGDLWRREAFLQKQPVSSQGPNDPRLLQSMTPSGKYFPIGVSNGRLIRAVPL